MLRHLALTVAAAFAVWLAGAASAFAAQPYPVNFHTFDLRTGTTSGLTLAGGSLGLASSGLGSLTYVDPSANNAGDGVDGSGIYQSGTWTSDVYPVSFPFNELVSSWNSKTPVGTSCSRRCMPQLDDGHWASKWYVLGRWSYNDSDFHRTSVGGQGDADGFVAIDTFFAKDHPAIAYRLRLTLFRRIGSTATPVVSRYSAVVSNLTNQKNVFPSATTMRGTTVDLNVPQYSQEIHHGEYPEFDNGGEAWCSPTSTSMVLGTGRRGRARHTRRPPRRQRGSTPRSPTRGSTTPRATSTTTTSRAPATGRSTRRTRPSAGSCGRVAAALAREAELFIKAGIPLVASIAFNSNSSTARDQEHERSPRRDRGLHRRRRK